MGSQQGLRETQDRNAPASCSLIHSLHAPRCHGGTGVSASASAKASHFPPPALGKKANRFPRLFHVSPWAPRALTTRSVKGRSACLVPETMTTNPRFHPLCNPSWCCTNSGGDETFPGTAWLIEPSEQTRVPFFLKRDTGRRNPSSCEHSNDNGSHFPDLEHQRQARGHPPGKYLLKPNWELKKRTKP